MSNSGEEDRVYNKDLLVFHAKTVNSGNLYIYSAKIIHHSRSLKLKDYLSFTGAKTEIGWVFN